MTDAEALETLEAFVRQHAVCGEQAISTEFTEHRDAAYLNVTKRCQAKVRNTCREGEGLTRGRERTL